MDCIKNLILPKIGEIEGTENEMTTLAFKMYDIIVEYLEEILHLKW